VVAKTTTDDSSPPGAVFYSTIERLNTRISRDWSSDVCSSDLGNPDLMGNTLVWNNIGNINAGATVDLTFRVASPTNQAGTFNNTDRKSVVKGKIDVLIVSCDRITLNGYRILKLYIR